MDAALEYKNVKKLAEEGDLEALERMCGIALMGRMGMGNAEVIKYAEEAMKKGSTHVQTPLAAILIEEGDYDFKQVAELLKVGQRHHDPNAPLIIHNLIKDKNREHAIEHAKMGEKFGNPQCHYLLKKVYGIDTYKTEADKFRSLLLEMQDDEFQEFFQFINDYDPYTSATIIITQKGELKFWRNNVRETTELEPQKRALYYLFLRHQEGIFSDEFDKYADELFKIYYTLRKRQISPLADGTMPWSNDSLYLDLKEWRDKKKRDQNRRHEIVQKLNSQIEKELTSQSAYNRLKVHAERIKDSDGRSRTRYYVNIPHDHIIVEKGMFDSDFISGDRESDDEDLTPMSFRRDVFERFAAEGDKYAMMYLANHYYIEEDDFYIKKYPDYVFRATKATELYKQSIKRGCKRAYLYLGFLYSYRKQYEKAIRTLKKCGEHDCYAVQAIGSCYFYWGKRVEAFEYYKKCVEMHWYEVYADFFVFLSGFLNAHPEYTNSPTIQRFLYEGNAMYRSSSDPEASEKTKRSVLAFEQYENLPRIDALEVLEDLREKRGGSCTLRSLTFTKNKRILLQLDNSETFKLPLSKKETALYLLLLERPQGIRQSDLDVEELARLYQMTKRAINRYGDKPEDDVYKSAIQLASGPQIKMVVSKIKTAIMGTVQHRQTLDELLILHRNDGTYYIPVDRGKVKLEYLPR